jgi:hypothetical protein
VMLARVATDPLTLLVEVGVVVEEPQPAASKAPAVMAAKAATRTFRLNICTPLWHRTGWRGLLLVEIASGLAAQFSDLSPI